MVADLLWWSVTRIDCGTMLKDYPSEDDMVHSVENRGEATRKWKNGRQKVRLNDSERDSVNWDF